jgi:hypothetical protein
LVLAFGENAATFAELARRRSAAFFANIFVLLYRIVKEE